MLAKKKSEGHSDKKYYIFDQLASITPVEEYKFNKKEKYLKRLVDSECFLIDPKNEKKKLRLNSMIGELGFKWDCLSEFGHMRQMPSATTILEAIEKYIWSVVNKFSNEESVPVHRISGGELFSANNPEIQKQISIISKASMYGISQYNVVSNKKNQILRYSACTQKLALAKEINLVDSDLPIGIFELSKSYRFEKEDEVCLCKRVRDFHLPELHIINNSLASSLERGLLVHAKILSEIGKFDSECELFCSVTYDFLKENSNYLKTIAESVNKPLLLAVYNEGANCGNGIKIDVEYKVFDTLNIPLELATFQVDNGTSDFSFGVEYKAKSGAKKFVSTIHAVFFGSLERAAYFLIDGAIKKEKKSGFRPLPFWVLPVQARIIPGDDNSLVGAKLLAEELNSLNFRVDFDDRKIPYSSKKKSQDIKYIPYLISVVRNKKGLLSLSLENKATGIVRENISRVDLIKAMKSENSGNIVVPLYTPMCLSKRKSLKA